MSELQDVGNGHTYITNLGLQAFKIAHTSDHESHVTHLFKRDTLELEESLLREDLSGYTVVNSEPFAGVTIPALSHALNDSIENATHGNETNNMYHFYQMEQVTFLCILFSFIVIGNSSVLIAILLSKNRKSRVNFFIMQLAIADLFTGVVTVLTDIIWKTTIEWHAGNVGCKVVRYTQGVTTFASTYVLVAMSIDRLDAIARPMNFTGSAKRARVLTMTAWGVAAAFSLPIIFLNQEMVVQGMKQCWIDMPERWQWRVYVTVLALLLFIIPAIIIAVCYTVIVLIIWSKGNMDGGQRKPVIRRFITKRNSTATSNGCNYGQNMKASSRGVIPKARIKTIKMTLVIVLVFIICWSPFFIFDLLDVYNHIPMSQSKVAIAVFIQSLAPLNSAANPVIYCLFSTRICSNWRLSSREGVFLSNHASSITSYTCRFRRLRFCDWMARKFCCCCTDGAPYANRRYSTTGGITDYSSIADSDHQNKRVRVSNRRHSGTPYVKVTLNEKENEILLKHIRKNGSHNVIVDTNIESDECISTV